MPSMTRDISVSTFSQPNVWELLVKRGGLEILRSERGALVQALASFPQITSVLEVGSGTGGNLSLLRLFAPELQYLGFDRNNAALRRSPNEGTSLFLEAEATKAFPIKTKSVDIVFSLASLLYVSGEEIERTLREMDRVSKLGIVLIEQHDEHSSPEGQFVLDESASSGYWIRDYRGLFSKLKLASEVAPIAGPLFETEQWKKYGSVVVHRKSKPTLLSRIRRVLE